MMTQTNVGKHRVTMWQCSPPPRERWVWASDNGLVSKAALPTLGATIADAQQRLGTTEISITHHTEAAP